MSVGMPGGCPEAPALFGMPFGWGTFGVEAGFTGRDGGVSHAPYQSLNLSFGRKDAPENVLTNYQRVADALHCETQSMVRVRQVHGARVAVVGHADAGIGDTVATALDGVDALVTRTPGVVLMTTHADCVPVYFWDPVLGVVALAHAGWGGVIAGVVEATIQKMSESYGCKACHLRVGIGPHIRSCCFEVRADVIGQFSEKIWWHPGLLQTRDGASFIDLSGCVREILTTHGVPPASISEQEACTCCLSERYFSHRGSGGHTGTGAAWIRLLPTSSTSSDVPPRNASKVQTKHAGLEPRRGAALKSQRRAVRATLLFGVCVLSLLLLLAGCAGTRIGGDAPPPVAPAGETQPAESPTADGIADTTEATTNPETTPKPENPLSGMGTVLLEDTGPARGGTLRLFMLPEQDAQKRLSGALPDSLNPLDSLNPEVLDCGWFLSDPLVTVTEDGIVHPLLAKEIRSTQDGRVWDITLPDGVLFHDGSPLEAEDVKTTLQRAAMATNGIFARGLRNLDKMEVVSRQKIRLILHVPDPWFTRNLSIPLFSANSWTIQEKPLQERFHPNGVGAFSLVEGDAEGITLARYEAWWQAQAGNPTGHPAWPDRVRFLYGETEGDRLTFFQQRQTDAAWTVEADLSRYQNRTDIEVRTFPGSRMEFVIAGARSRQLQREPIRNLLLRYLAGARGEIQLSGDPVADIRFSPLTRDEVIPLLVEAGCRFQQKGDSVPVLSIPGTDGLRTAAFSIRYNALSVERLKSAEWLAEALAPIGITCYLQEVATEDAKKLVANGQFDLLLLGGDFPVGLTDDEMRSEMRQSLPASVIELMPLYRERRAMLYNTRIRGVKQPTATQAYGGWPEWYLLEPVVEGAVP